jgi:ABC-type Fe3+ transport system permease subunit
MPKPQHSPTKTDITARIQESAAVAGNTDGLEAYEAERKYLLREKDFYENERLRDENNELRKVHDLRQSYLKKLFLMIVFWLIAVLICVVLSALNSENPNNTKWTLPFSFNLKESVLIAFITSTTVSVLGLFITAAAWLFGSKKKDSTK